MKTAIRNYGTMLTTLFFALGLSVITLANDGTGNPEKKEPANDNLELKFVGKFEDHPVYQLNLNGAEADEYIVSFRSTDGTVVYASTVKGNFSQRFLLRADDPMDKTVRLEVKAKNSKKSRIYIIRSSESLVEQNEVVKVQ